MKLTVINQNIDFWDNRSDSAYPALLQYGYTLFVKDGEPTVFKRVIYSNGQPQSSSEVGYSYVGEIPPKSGISNTGNLYRQPSGDIGLFTLSKAYPALDIFYGATENDPIWVTFDQIAAIDTTGIPEEDFRITIEGLLVTDMASEPFTNYQVEEGNYQVEEGNYKILKTF